MSEKIDPALRGERSGSIAPQAERTRGSLTILSSRSPSHAARIIALANAALPDSDPRKITRERLLEVKKAVDIWFAATATANDTLADREIVHR